MTNRDLLIQLLCEASGEKKALITLKLHLVMRAMEEKKAGSTADFYKDFNEEEANIILTNMRQQQTQIVGWFNRLVKRLESS